MTAGVDWFDDVPRVGPTVGPDEHGAAGPAWIVTADGHTTRGWRWFVIRKRGGFRRRVTLAPGENTPQGAVAAIDRHVASMPTKEHPWPQAGK